MQIRIQRGKYKTTVQCLRAFYDSEKKRTRQVLVASFDKYEAPTSEQLAQLTDSEREEVTDFLTTKKTESAAYTARYAVQNADEKILSYAEMIRDFPIFATPEIIEKIEISIKGLQKSIKTVKKIHAKRALEAIENTPNTSATT